jgi:hypothetical protein
VAGGPGTNLFVGRVVHLSPGIAGDDRVHPFQDSVGGIETPKTTPCKHVSFHALRVIPMA